MTVYKTGKIRDAQCPICGEYMEMGEIKIERKKVRFWYCKNPKHAYTSSKK